jgi:hypothetical protein
LVTIRISGGAFVSAASTTRNWVVGEALLDAGGAPVDDATVRVSDVPAVGAVVPPAVTVHL